MANIEWKTTDGIHFYAYIDDTKQTIGAITIYGNSVYTAMRYKGQDDPEDKDFDTLTAAMDWIVRKPIASEIRQEALQKKEPLAFWERVAKLWEYLKQRRK